MIFDIKIRFFCLWVLAISSLVRAQTPKDTNTTTKTQWSVQSQLYSPEPMFLQTGLVICAKVDERNSFYAGATYILETEIMNSRNKDKFILHHNPRYINPNYGKYFRIWYNSSVLQNMGLILAHQYLLSKPHRRAKVYFETNFNFYGYKETRDTLLYLTSIHHEMALSTVLALKVRFLKRFYYYGNIGLAYYIGIGKEVHTGYKDKYMYVGPSGSVLGLGYNF